MTLEEKNRIENLMRQADFHIGLFNQRREYSWKVALAFWGGILGAGTLLNQASLNWFYVLLGAVLVILLHGFWLNRVFEADQKDKLVAFKCRDLAIQLINETINTSGENIKTPPLSHGRKFRDDWSVLFQLGTTIFLVASMSFLVLSN